MAGERTPGECGDEDPHRSIFVHRTAGEQDPADRPAAMPAAIALMLTTEIHCREPGRYELVRNLPGH